MLSCEFFFFLSLSFTLVFHASFYSRFRGMKSEKDQEPGCCNYDCDHFCFSYLSMCLYSVPLSIPLFLCRFIFIHAQRIYNLIYNVHYKKGNIGVQYASVVFFPCLFVCVYSWPLYLLSESEFVYKCHFVESDAFLLNLSDSTSILSILYITKNIHHSLAVVLVIFDIGNNKKNDGCMEIR